MGLQAFQFNIEWIPGLRIIADPFSRMVIICDADVAMNTKSLVFGSDLGLRMSTELSQGSPIQAALFTWSLTEFPPQVGLPSRCLTKVLTTLCPAEVEPLLSTDVDQPLTALTIEGSAPISPDAVEIGNVHTLLTQGYSTKDKGKLRALLRLREFFISGKSPVADNKWIP